MTRLLLILPLLLTGCAKYEYDLVQPPDLARHIGPNWETLNLAPLEYRLRSYEDRLILHIHNPTKAPIRIAGDQSYIIAPGGQSHPLRSQTIAPDSFIRLILPPMRGVYRSGPSVGFGFGFAYGGPRRYYYGGPRYWMYDEPAYYPSYYTVYDDNDNTYWVWNDESDARLHLIFQRGSESFSHDFTLHRKKIN